MRGWCCWHSGLTLISRLVVIRDPTERVNQNPAPLGFVTRLLACDDVWHLVAKYWKLKVEFAIQQIAGFLIYIYLYNKCNMYLWNSLIIHYPIQQHICQFVCTYLKSLTAAFSVVFPDRFLATSNHNSANSLLLTLQWLSSIYSAFNGVFLDTSTTKLEGRNSFWPSIALQPATRQNRAKERMKLSQRFEEATPVPDVARTWADLSFLLSFAGWSHTKGNWRRTGSILRLLLELF